MDQEVPNEEKEEATDTTREDEVPKNIETETGEKILGNIEEDASMAENIEDSKEQEKRKEQE